MSNIQCCLPLSVMPLNILKYILKSKTAMNSSQKPWLLDYISGQLLITAICTSAVVKTTNCFCSDACNMSNIKCCLPFICCEHALKYPEIRFEKQDCYELFLAFRLYFRAPLNNIPLLSQLT